MKQKNIISLGAVAVALAAVVGISAVSLASTDTQTTAAETIGQHRPQFARQQLTESQRQEMEAKRQAVDNALTANDYQAWLEAVGADSEQAKIITSDKFPQLVQAHQLMREARTKMEASRQIREQLGLKGPVIGPGFGEARGHGNKQSMLKGQAQCQKLN